MFFSFLIKWWWYIDVQHTYQIQNYTLKAKNVKQCNNKTIMFIPVFSVDDLLMFHLTQMKWLCIFCNWCNFYGYLHCPFECLHVTNYLTEMTLVMPMQSSTTEMKLAQLFHYYQPICMLCMDVLNDTTFIPFHIWHATFNNHCQCIWCIFHGSDLDLNVCDFLKSSLTEHKNYEFTFKWHWVCWLHRDQQ